MIADDDPMYLTKEDIEEVCEEDHYKDEYQSFPDIFLELTAKSGETFALCEPDWSGGYPRLVTFRDEDLAEKYETERFEEWFRPSVVEKVHSIMVNYCKKYQFDRNNMGIAIMDWIDDFENGKSFDIDY